jgi:hypothetical protein
MVIDEFLTEVMLVDIEQAELEVVNLSSMIEIDLIEKDPVVR